MKAEDLVRAGVCVSMAEGRHLSSAMEKSERCRKKVIGGILPEAVKLWFDIFTSESRWSEEKCLKEAIQRAFSEGAITEEKADMLEEVLLEE